MLPCSHIELLFFEDRYKSIAREIEQWVATHLQNPATGMLTMSGAGWSSRWANQGGLNTRSGLQNTQARPAEMATGVDSLALLTYCPAWISDRGRHVTVEAAMAKMLAPETAQRSIDAGVQIFGGLGLRSMSAKVLWWRSPLSLGSDRTKNAI